MKKFLTVIAIGFICLLGVALGGFLGFWIPWDMAQQFVEEGGDETAAGAFSFLPILTVPAGGTLGGFLGLILADLFEKKLQKKSPPDRPVD